VNDIRRLIDLVDWHRLKWFGVLAIGLTFVAASGYILAVSRDPFAFVAIAFGMVMVAMAMHDLWPSLIEGRPASPDLVLQGFPGPVTMRTPWRKLVFFLVSTIVFGGCLGAMALYSDMGATGLAFMWLGAAGCAAAVPAFLLMLFRGSALRLEAGGFQIVHATRRSFHRWSDTSEFSVVDVGIPMVVFDEAALTGGMLAEINRSLIGRIGGLPDTYGMDAWTLAALLNEWRARALASPQPASRSSPVP
jgi:hypothetical protein